jgi:transcription initiation factor TFIIB
LKKRFADSIFSKCNETDCQKGPLITDENAGEIMCGGCGTVLIERIEDSGPEHSAFTKEDYMHNTRTGMKSTLTIYDMGLSTSMKNDNKDASGKKLSPEMKLAFYRLRMWDTRAKLKTKDRSMRNAFLLLDGMVTKLGLSEAISEKSAYFYRKIKARKSKTGRSTAALITACLYAACRFTNSPRTIIDVVSVSTISKKLLQKIYRDIVKELDLTLESFDPLDFVTRLASNVNASERTRRKAIKLLIRARKAGIITGKHPMGMTAAALYFACALNNENISQTQISKASGITNVTIRKQYQTLKNSFGISPLDSLT